MVLRESHRGVLLERVSSLKFRVFGAQIKEINLIGKIFYELFNIILINFKNLYDLYGLILAT